MGNVLDLRDVFAQSGRRTLQVETKYGEVLQGKFIIVDAYSGRQGTFRKITDLRAYQESHGLCGVQELTLHAIDIRAWRMIE
jgi:hypothetical protein